MTYDMDECRYCRNLGGWDGIPRCETHPTHSLMAAPIGTCAWHGKVGMARWAVRCARCATVTAQVTVIPGQGRTITKVDA
jgi:hypothetical protein